MGVTIHYRGKLETTSSLPRLIDELLDIAQCMRWKCRVIDDDWRLPVDARLESTADGLDVVGNTGLRGVVLTPPRYCEPLAFVFTRRGRLCDPVHRVMSIESGRRLGKPWMSTKTQFAPAETHMWICGLLRYIKRAYIPDLEVRDEGKYWETANPRVLRSRLEKVNRVMQQLRSKLSSPEARKRLNSCDSPEQIADWIARQLKGQAVHVRKAPRARVTPSRRTARKR